MKKSILVLALTALAWIIRADEVTSEQACAAVEAWRAANGAAFGSVGSVVSAVAQRDTDGTLLWYVVSTADGSTVVAAGDDGVEPILAVLPGEDFGGVIPDAHPLYSFMRMDVRGRLASKWATGTSSAGGAPSLQSVGPAMRTLTSSAQAAKSRWSRLAGTGAALQAATSGGMPPMVYGYLPGFSDGSLCHWNQSSSIRSNDEALYNYYTPYGYVCGCVATAAAAMLQYFNVTNGPVAVTNTCTVNGCPTNLVTIGGTYDWSILPKGMGGQAENPIELLTDAQRELLGRVTYDCGVLVGMGYDGNGTGSGAMTAKIADAFKKHYGFKTGECINFEGDKKKDVAFYDRIIYNQLRCGAPVNFGIYTEAGGGHSVVAVGYAEDFAGTAYTRVFMGWGGSGDAWYNLPDIAEYKYLIQAVTLLSTDGNCTPVCGRVVTSVPVAASDDQRADNTTGAAFVPVEVTVGDETQTLYTAANGCFAIRVAEGASGSVKVGDETITFGASEEEGEEEETEEAGEKPSKLQAAYDALPETMLFTLPEDEVIPDYPTPAAALAAANRKTADHPNGRMLLLVSGRAGDAASEALRAMLAERVDDINANFVVYYVDYDTDSFSLWNAYPALAVFNPAVFDPANGWSAFNGCLASFNTGDVPTDEDLDALFSATATAWSRINNGDMVLKVDGISMWVDIDGNRYRGGTEAGGYDPMLGLQTSFTNGEAVVATVPAVYTNFEAGVVSACTGWALVEGTNVSAREVWIDRFKVNLLANDPELFEKVFETNDYESVFAYLDSGDGTTAAFEFGYPEATLVWLWDDVAYHVTAEAMREGGMSNDGYGSVDLDEAWIKPGEELTITAMGAVKGSASRPQLTQLKGWGKLEDAQDDDMAEGCTLTFRVVQQRHVVAYFNTGASYPSELPKLDVTVAAEPAELLAEADFPQPKFGQTALVYGENSAVFNTNSQAAVTLTATTFTDSTGGVWRCTGWTNGAGDIAPTGACAHVAFTATQASSITFTWTAEGTAEEEPLELELKWGDTLDNLQSGDSAAAGQNILVAKSALPRNFNLADYSAKDVKNSLTGWTVTGLKLDTSGNLVAVLATNDAVLIPKGVGVNAPLTIVSNGDGTVTVSSTIANAAKGFWYSLFAANDLGGPWSVVASGEYDSGTSSLQATSDGTLGADGELSIVVSPTDSKRFYRLRVTEKRPE